MKKAILAAVLAFWVRDSSESFVDTPKFEKVSDHCYYMSLEESGENVAVVVTEEGILMVDPPEEPGLSLAVDALKRISTKAVRWVLFTNPSFSTTAGARFFAEKGASFLASSQLRALAKPAIEGPLKDASESESEMENGHFAGEAPFSSWLIFDHQMRLFPSNLEIRIVGLRHKARTGGDVVAYVPAEKVLFVGDLYEAARYPDIDISLGGSAVEWISGLKEVIDAVPVLKPAIPQEKSNPKEEQERTLEERITVISGHGESSNLQNMMDLLDACQKLQRYVSRAVKMGRTCDDFLASSVSNPYRSYGNLAPYAEQLFEALLTAPDQPRSPNRK
jgi:glyoxylase-like metal-dependent hydrolase (beta-lactamase superfamily II)